MISKIIRFSIEHKFTILLLVITLIAGGLYSLNSINVDSTPDITNNQVQVITVSENLSTADIEQFVTYPIELSMSNLPGVEDIRSISRFGLSVVTVVFSDDMGTYLPRQLVQEKLEEVRNEIPAEFGSPEMGPITTGLGEIFQYTLVPKDTNKYSPQELRTLQDWVVKRQLALIPGVVEVNSFGGSIKQYEVSINPDKLKSMNVSINELYEALRINNANTGGAYIEKNHMAHFIRGEGLIKTTDDIKNIVIKIHNNAPVLVGDVAENVHAGSQVRYGAFTQDGHEAVGGMILMLKGANSDKVVTAVKERMNEVQKSLPKDITIKPFLDRSELINRTTNTIAKNLIEGALIVIFVLVLLLGSLRGGLITASVIPLALLFAFILMKIFDVWANLMSLGAIDFGIIVDGAVIIVEGIVHETEKYLRKNNTIVSQTDMDKISFESASTMMSSAFFGQLIILIVFTPILFLTGISGKMFQPMAYTFSFAVLGAIILCLTYVPVVSSLILKPFKNEKSIIARLEKFLEHSGYILTNKITHAYSTILEISLKHKKVVLGIAIALFISTGLLFSQMGGEFIPDLDEGDIAMQTFLRPGSSLSETIKREQEVEKVLLESFPEIKTVCARIGVADIPTDPMGFDYTDSFIILEKDKSKWVSAKTKEELIEKIEERLSSLPGLNFSFSQPVALRFNELLTGIREDIAVKLYGEDLDKLNELGEQMVSIISKIPGANDVSLERTAGLPQITVSYNRFKLAQYGLNIEKVNTYISSAFAGGKAGVIFDGEKKFDLVIRFDESYRKNIDNLKNLYIDTPDGNQIPLNEIATVQYQPGPMQISRDQTSRRIYVGINVRGRDVESLVSEIQQKLDEELKLPVGYHITYGGEFQNLQEAKDRLKIVLPIALILIFILLYFALNSFTQSLMIYMAVPLATIGGVFFLYLRGMSFSISAGVGFIVLFGVAVLNGLVLINRFNSLKGEGTHTVEDIIFTGTKERLRPILLTATAAMLGFVPMAISDSAGAEVQRPLATVVIGGLFSATILTLIIIPILYSFMGKNKIYLTGKLSSLIGLGFICCILSPQKLSAQQTISLESAIEKSMNYYPSYQAALKEIESSKALKKTAWNIGTTEISTEGEEIGKNGDPTYTLISVRQNIDLAGIGAKSNYQNSMINISTITAQIAELELKKNVSADYAKCFISKQKLAAIETLDSLFKDVENLSKLRYETQAISYLEYLTTSNQAKHICMLKKQAEDNYKLTLQNLNKWIGENETFCVDDDFSLTPLDSNEMQHAFSSVLLSKEQGKLSEAQTKVDNSQYYPQLFVEYGSQKVGGNNGFHSYQIGISGYLFMGALSGKTKSSKINHDIAELNTLQQEITAQSEFNALQTEYKKQKETFDYYCNTILPMNEEQKKIAVTAFKEGAIDYIEFIQNMRNVSQTEIDYLDTYQELLIATFNLIYFY
ncbi:MAG: CusA/CzcA family heavy metal efflux RND transporter [Bacteroidales bacterium]|nr:CusA/CzcA family heavy metal efflux RND transporter [Bacteroidales bacterium]